MKPKLFVFFYDGFHAYLHLVGGDVIACTELESAIEAMTNLHKAGYKQSLKPLHVLPIQNKLMNPGCHATPTDTCQKTLNTLKIDNLN